MSGSVVAPANFRPTREHPVFARNRSLVAARESAARAVLAEEKRANSLPVDVGLREGTILNVIAPRSSSGANVNIVSASTVPVFGACVSLLADMVAKLPIKLYQRTPEGAVERPDHPAFQAFAVTPSALSSSFELRHLAQTGYGYGGNGYIRVWRDSYYRPAELQWLPPLLVQPELFRQPDGRMYAIYKIWGEPSSTLTRADIIHVRGPSINGLTGMSPIAQLRESLGLSITQREQAGKIAVNGARFPGVLSTPASLNKDQLADARAEWQRNQGDTANAGKTAILQGAWSYAATNGMSMADAEFLESRKFERTEICTLFRIPEVLLGNSDKTSSWGTGIEMLTDGFRTLTVDPVLVNWEQAIGYTLLTTEERAGGLYFEFDRRALLAVLLESQGNFLRNMRDIGAFSVNDCRTYLGENRISPAIGDNYAQPFNGTGGAPKPAAAPKIANPAPEPAAT